MLALLWGVRMLEIGLLVSLHWIGCVCADIQWGLGSYHGLSLAYNEGGSIPLRGPEYYQLCFTITCIECAPWCRQPLRWGQAKLPGGHDRFS